MKNKCIVCRDERECFEQYAFGFDDMEENEISLELPNIREQPVVCRKCLDDIKKIKIEKAKWW